jgi:hypothetical protein
MTPCVTEHKFVDTTVLVIKVHILKQAQPPGNGRQRQDSIINRNDNELHTQICRTLSIQEILHIIPEVSYNLFPLLIFTLSW